MCRVDRSGGLAALMVMFVLLLAACGRGTDTESVSVSQEVPESVATSVPDGSERLAVSRCGTAEDFEETLTISSAYETTVAGVRAWRQDQIALDWEASGEEGQTAPADAVPWESERSSDEEATLCYIDGPINKAPPPGPDGDSRGQFTRRVSAVFSDGSSVTVVLGYADTIPDRSPPS